MENITKKKVLIKIKRLAENSNQYNINFIKKELATIAEMLQQLSYFDESIKNDTIKIKQICTLINYIQNKDLAEIPIKHIKLSLASLLGKADVILNY